MTLFASEAARRLAASLGLERMSIAGTGRNGAVTVDDVRNAVPAVPEGLGEHGAALYRRVQAEWDLRPDEEAILLAAARTVDELTILEAAMTKAKPVVQGSKGQPRANPLVHQVREHRLALRLLLSSLGIREAEADAPGASKSASRSNAGRQLALIRHGSGRGSAA